MAPRWRYRRIDLPLAGINPGVGDQDGVDEAVLRALRPVILMRKLLASEPG